MLSTLRIKAAYALKILWAVVSNLFAKCKVELAVLLIDVTAILFAAPSNRPIVAAAIAATSLLAVKFATTAVQPPPPSARS